MCVMVLSVWYPSITIVKRTCSAITINRVQTSLSFCAGNQHSNHVPIQLIVALYSWTLHNIWLLFRKWLQRHNARWSCQGLAGAMPCQSKNQGNNPMHLPPQKRLSHPYKPIWPIIWEVLRDGFLVPLCYFWYPVTPVRDHLCVKDR